VRALRPFAPTIGFLAYLLYRTTSSTTSGNSNINGHPGSLLHDLINLLSQARSFVLQRLVVSNDIDSDNGIVTSVIVWSWTFLEDLMAITAMVCWIRWLYVLCHYSWQNDYKLLLSRKGLEWAQHYVPAVNQKIQQQTQEMILKGDEMLNKDPNRTLTLTLPAQGRTTADILQELETFAVAETKNWSSGKLSGTVYHSMPPTSSSSAPEQEDQHGHLINQVYKAYAWSNPLHPGIWPKIGQCEGEVISMTAQLMNAPKTNNPAVGCLTAGGTESIMLAIRAHLQYYGKQRSIQYPELICGSTAHAAVDKACDVFNIRKVVIDCSRYQHALDPQAVRKHLTSNTIMIYASAPTYPQGIIDPIEQLSKLALEYDVGLHVDSCLGGFVLPFLKGLEEYKDYVPSFDFTNPGVTSMSADTHKFGAASKGTSVVMYRHTALRHGQYFCYPHWTGGMYTTPTFAGSRPGALSACAWAAMVSIGFDGYQKRAQAIVQAARTIGEGVASIDGLELLTKKPYMVVCFGAAAASEEDNRSQEDELCIYRVQDMMKNFGWALNAMQSPASVHICVTANVVPKVNELIRDLKVAVAQVKKEGASGRKKGTAGIYGTAGSVPAGAIEPTLRAFTDLTLAP